MSQNSQERSEHGAGPNGTEVLSKVWVLIYGSRAPVVTGVLFVEHLVAMTPELPSSALSLELRLVRLLRANMGLTGRREQ